MRTLLYIRNIHVVRLFMSLVVTVMYARTSSLTHQSKHTGGLRKAENCNRNIPAGNSASEEVRVSGVRCGVLCGFQDITHLTLCPSHYPPVKSPAAPFHKVHWLWGNWQTHERRLSLPKTSRISFIYPSPSVTTDDLISETSMFVRVVTIHAEQLMCCKHRYKEQEPKALLIMDIPFNPAHICSR